MWENGAVQSELDRCTSHHIGTHRLQIGWLSHHHARESPCMISVLRTLHISSPVFGTSRSLIARRRDFDMLVSFAPGSRYSAEAIHPGAGNLTARRCRL